MQPAQHQLIPACIPIPAMQGAFLSPAAMAQHLRRASGPAALCFALAMHEEAAWANEQWGAYWADVIREV